MYLSQLSIAVALTLSCTFCTAARTEAAVNIHIFNGKIVIFGEPKAEINGDEAHVWWNGSWYYRAFGEKLSQGSWEFDTTVSLNGGDFHFEQERHGLKLKVEGNVSRGSMRVKCKGSFTFRGQTATLGTFHFSADIVNGNSVPKRSVFPSGFEARCRAARRWARKNGYSHAYPNFEQARNNDGQRVYGVIAFPEGVAEKVDVPASDLGNPGNVSSRIRAVHRWARRNDRGRALPDFEERTTNGTKYYGVVCFPRRQTVVKDISAEELGNPSNDKARFRNVHRWAVKNGYSSGFPNFEQATRDGETFYGVVLIKRPFTAHHDVIVE